MTTTATVYLRQSLDRDKTGLAVERQEAECRALIQDMGWSVGPIFRDNDASATSGKRRPGFEAMLTSQPEVIVSWAQDRLARVGGDMERVIALGVPVHTKTGSPIEPTVDGHLVARIMTAVATGEIERKNARHKAAIRQQRQNGIQPMGRMRLFGYDQHRYLDAAGRRHTEVTLNETEAAEARQAIDAVLAGESLSSVVRDLNSRGVTTTAGNEWTVSTLRHSLANPRLCGRVVSKGVDYGWSDGPVVVDPETHQRFLDLLADPARRAHIKSRQARYLMTGLLECGRCGATMYSAQDSTRRAGEKVHTYRCPKCALSRRQETVDVPLVGVLLEYLASHDAADLLRVDDLGAARVEYAALVEQREALADLVGLVSRQKIQEKRANLEPRLDAARRRVEAAEGRSPLAALVGVDDVEAAWEGLSLEQQRAALRALPWRAVVHPLGRGKRIQAGHVTWEK